MLRISANNLMDIINDVLDMSKIEAGHLEIEKTEFDLWDVVESIGIALNIKATQRGNELLCHIKPDVPKWIIGDPVRLRQILINLTGNAVKFTENGEIVISVEEIERKGSNIILQFSVRDTGIGIPKEMQEKIFESFSQAEASTTRKYGGTGLGLTISKQLVEMMEGRICVQSKVSKGSIFNFTIPTVEIEKPKEIKKEIELAEIKGIRVLVVDDNKTNRIILNETLSTWKALPDEAQSGKAAMEKLEKAKNEGKLYQFFLLDKNMSEMDVQMPEMDGVDATIEIRKIEKATAKHIPIIALTAHAFEEDKKKCLEAGMDGYSTKPIDIQKLFATIEELLIKSM